MTVLLGWLVSADTEQMQQLLHTCQTIICSDTSCDSLFKLTYHRRTDIRHVYASKLAVSPCIIWCIPMQCMCCRAYHTEPSACGRHLDNMHVGHKMQVHFCQPCQLIYCKPVVQLLA